MADADDVINTTPLPPTQYDDELLGAHYITGDGRGNENIGLTAVHFVFHAEHNRLVEHIDEVLSEGGNADLLAAYQEDKLGSNGWDYGERLFQAARFVTEMEYQHLAFEEFARTVQPTIDNQPLNETAYHHDINPAVSAEFAHVVYRFGHSMLTDTLPRSGTYAGHTPDDLSLLDGFLNPLAFTDSGTMTPEAGAASVIVASANRPATASTSSSTTRCATNCSGCRSTSRRSTSPAVVTPACPPCSRPVLSSTRRRSTPTSSPTTAGRTSGCR